MGSGALIQMACASDGATTEPKGVAGLAVVIRGHGNGRDADSFSAVRGRSERPASYDSPVTFESLSPSQHTVRLAGVATHCLALAESVVRQPNAGVTDTVTFDVTCVGGLLYHVLTSAMEGQIVYVGEDGQKHSRHDRTRKTARGVLVAGWHSAGVLERCERRAATLHRSFGRHRPRGAHLRCGHGRGPRWSPDGSQVAFTHFDTDKGGSWIVLANGDGSNRRVLMDSTHNDFDAVWSADGAQALLQLRSIRPTDRALYRVFGWQWSATNQVRRDHGARSSMHVDMLAIDAAEVDVSPDGRSIAFETLFTSSDKSQTTWVAAGRWVERHKVQLEHVVPSEVVPESRSAGGRDLGWPEELRPRHRASRWYGISIDLELRGQR